MSAFLLPALVLLLKKKKKNGHALIVRIGEKKRGNLKIKNKKERGREEGKTNA